MGGQAQAGQETTMDELMDDGGGMLWGMGWIDLLVVAIGALALAALTKHLFFSRAN
ncbi:MAG: hypothetical protein ACYC1L_06150 [Alphaproteobacteria bacterium]